MARQALSRGFLEILIALVIISAEVLSPRLTSVPGYVLALDLAAVAVVVITVRWPRVGGVVTIVLAFTGAAIDPSAHGFWPYLLIVPVVAHLRRGLWSQAAAVAAAVFISSVVASARLLGDEFRPFEVILGWAAIHGLFLLVGLGLYAASRNAAEAEARRQRDLRVDAALDLHDTVARELTVIALEASAAQDRGGATPEELGSLAERARTAGSALRETIRVIQGTQPSVDDVGFVDALAQSVAALRKRGHPVVTSGELSPALSAEADRALGRIITEALHNAAKHATRRGSCTIVGEAGEGTYEVVVTNSAAPDTPLGAGLGLLGMRHRAALVGGSVRYNQSGDLWTCLIAVPMVAEAAVGA